MRNHEKKVVQKPVLAREWREDFMARPFMSRKREKPAECE